ncbi:MAG: hypothetical protein K2O14_08850 [Oscillospiraceae bacterium]|nr:hypothetical protein [Oscillospiraceae bacterium]
MIGNILSIDDVRKALELSEFSDSEMAEDVDSVVYRRDIFEYSDESDEKDIDVHIDIEFEYGEYLELREDDPAFQQISRLCVLPTDIEELVLYRKQ